MLWTIFMILLITSIEGTDSFPRCDFAVSFPDTRSIGQFGSFSDFDITTNLFYMVARRTGYIIQFDDEGTVRNALYNADFAMNGVIVYSSGGKVLVFGEDAFDFVMIVIDKAFSILMNRLYAGTDLEKASSDGNGHIYFLGDESGRSVLVKFREEDYSIVYERDYGHFN